MGVNFSKEFVFKDVGGTGVTMESVLETQVTSNTILDFEDIENATAIEGPNEVLEADEREV